jgi:hypothetical protein
MNVYLIAGILGNVDPGIDTWRRKVQMDKNSKGLFRYYSDCERQGSLEGTFVAEKIDVENAIGKHVSFGEVLGKHSDVNGIIEREEIELLTDDQEFIAKFVELKCESGFNPLEYIRCDDCGERESYCECGSESEPMPPCSNCQGIDECICDE